ncbi:MAG: ATP-binding cassette domain-containing protein, partial [Gaiellales bacterium]
VVSHDPAAAVIADRSVRVRDGRLSGETPRAGEEAMVIGRTGWMHLPASVRRAGGLGSLVRAQPTPDGVLLTPADGASTPAPTAPRTEESRDARAGGGVVAELRGVDKAFGQGRRRRRVFAGLDAGFQRGLLTVVTGRSGTGKSTLLHLLAGLEQPDAGEVTVLGEQLAGRDRGELAEFRRRNLALVGQQPGLVPFLSAEENVVLALTLRGVDEAEARARSGLWLSRLGLEHRLVHRVERLSAGERQRVAIARALAARPGVLLVDEPTSRLDRANAELTGRLLAEASSRHGETIVCATHDPLLVDRADRRLDLAG